jgi:hypothetical protein
VSLSSMEITRLDDFYVAQRRNYFPHSYDFPRIYTDERRYGWTGTATPVD